MPRTSERQQAIKRLERQLVLLYNRCRQLPHDTQEYRDQNDLLLIVYLQWLTVTSHRYFLPRTFRILNMENGETLDQLLTRLAGDKDWLNDTEFRAKYRMSKNDFSTITEMMEATPIFANATERMRPVSIQFGVFLFYVGNTGKGGNNPQARNIFAIGRGTIELYKTRCLKAILYLGNQFLQWPDAATRRSTSDRIHNEQYLPRCVGFVDGTLIPLMEQPLRADRADFFGRKEGYSLSSLIVCDDRRRIMYHYSGWAGASHDSRIFRNSILYRNPAAFFADGEYLLADSAFNNTNHTVSTFRLPARGIRLPQDQHDFNQAVSSIRVANEHTIGILKNRFQILKQLPIRITEEVESMERAIDCIEACCVLHNILHDLSQNEDDMEWYNQVDDNDGHRNVDENNNFNEVHGAEMVVNIHDHNAEIYEGNLGNDDDAAIVDNINDIIVEVPMGNMVPQQLTEQLRNDVKRYREDIINLMQHDEDNDEN
jgi:hypothetical protein